jgi:alkanesulfonate monooxygenase SsuD/methylene tetrahydromethanopterin reductase-like flavin-dependent oxidoreductase (luciferase family)
MVEDQRMGDQLTWGAVLPHGGAAEFDGWEPTRAWERLAEVAASYDALGFDHLWMSDHLMGSAGDRSGLYFESYTAMAALAAVTSRAKLGAIVTCAQYRSVAMLAKQAANVDLMSGGRFILALGGGWDEGEFAAYGLPFPSPGERVAVFGETLEAIRRLWTEDRVTYAGAHVHLCDAVCSPRPATLPEIWTGAHGDKALRHTARFADVANWNVGLEEFIRLSAVLSDACAEVGRDPDTIETSVFRLGDLSGGTGSLPQLLERLGAPANMADEVARDHFIGDPDEVAGRVQAFVDAGARHVVVLFIDAAMTTVSAESFVRDVIPEVAVGSR